MPIPGIDDKKFTPEQQEALGITGAGSTIPFFTLMCGLVRFGGSCFGVNALHTNDDGEFIISVLVASPGKPPVGLDFVVTLGGKVFTQRGEDPSSRVQLDSEDSFRFILPT